MESDEALSHVGRRQQSQADDTQPDGADQTTEIVQTSDTLALETSEHDGRSSDSTEGSNSFQEASEFIPLEETPSGYPELDWKPPILRKWCLLLAIAFFVACLTGLAIIVRVNDTRPELLHVARTPSQLAFRYVPAATGTVSSIWWSSLTRSYLRLVPYISMASVSNAPKGRGSQDNDTIQSTGDLEAFSLSPSSIFRLIKERHVLTVIMFLTSFLVGIFLAPLKSTLFQTIPDSEGWTIYVSDKIAYGTIALYSLMTASAIAILIRLWSVRTGLKWEVSSITSQLALVQNSNIYEPFHGLEFAYDHQFWNLVRSWPLKYGGLRLGYWKSLRKLQLQTPLSFEGCEVDDPERFRYASLYIEQYDSVLAFFLAIGVALFVTCIVGMSRDIAHRGFYFTPPVPTASIALAQQTLFTFLPALLFDLLSIEVNTAAYFYRLHQPIANMQSPVSAEKSVLLDYVGRNAASAMLTAAANKHWRVAWLSFLDSVSAIPLILVANAVNAEETPDGWHVNVTGGKFYSLFALLIVYCVSIVLCRPLPEYRTLMVVSTLAELLTLCYDSHMLDGNEFSVQDASDREIHLVSKVHLAKRKYQFGLYMGRDGRRHLGFDATSDRAIEGDVPPVYGIEPGRAIYFTSRPLWLRPPVVKYPEGEDISI
ncbi:unnamed protein product [Penicillium salamii]|nr:unnamed protein product [Penicillium salamii]CAG7965157.1 unnamed protein product [Penicillium salamii]CAG8418431.1 unnamed protein product [Penicillium salamii]